jgi:hypothetical protein
MDTRNKIKGNILLKVSLRYLEQGTGHILEPEDGQKMDRNLVLIPPERYTEIKTFGSV